MPVIHVFTAEGFTTQRRRELLIEKITEAVVEAEGRPELRHSTYVHVVDLGDPGWNRNSGLGALPEI